MIRKNIAPAGKQQPPKQVLAAKPVNKPVAAVKAIADKRPANPPKTVLKVNGGKVSLQHSVPGVLNPKPPQMKVPKIRGDEADRFMDRHNPYLASLRDPLRCPGARIPDDSSMVESTTVQVIYHDSVVANANGVAGVIIGVSGRLPYVNPGTGAEFIQGPFLIPNPIPTIINGVTLAGAVGLKTNSTTLANTPFSENASAGLGSTPFEFPGLYDFFSNYATNVRIVSYSLVMRTTANYTNNQGYFVAGSVPHDSPQSGAVLLEDIPLSMWVNAPGATRVACIEAVDGMTVTYTPYDNRCFQFSNLVSIPFGDTTADISENPGVLYIIAEGQNTTTPPTFLFDIVVNYEFIPKTGVLNVGARPKYVDPIALAVAFNARQGDDLAYVGNDTDGSEGEHFTEKLNDGKHAVAVSCGSFASQDNSFLGGSYIHAFTHPVVITTKRSKAKRNTIARVAQVEEKPMFESVVDGLLKVAKKVAPMLLSLL